jgi:hypothetical protein
LSLGGGLSLGAGSCLGRKAVVRLLRL